VLVYLPGGTVILYTVLMNIAVNMPTEAVFAITGALRSSKVTY